MRLRLIGQNPRSPASFSVSDPLLTPATPIGALAISPHLVRKVPFDIQKDLQPIAQTANGQMLLAASASGPFKSVREVIEYARQNPGKLAYASSGNGTPGHVGLELFKALTGTQIVHVPYKGGAAGIADLIGGQVQLMLEGMNSITPHARAGRVRSLGVSGARRSDGARSRCSPAAAPTPPTVPRGTARLEPIGRVELKGIPEPVALWRASATHTC